MKRQALIVTAGVVWLLAMAAGLSQLHAYMNTPGLSQKSPATWPTNSGLDEADGEARILAFIHDSCPCSRATLTNLQAVAKDLDAIDRVMVIFVGKRDETGRNARSLNEQADALGATKVRDVHGEIALRFGARTSGHVLAYSREGDLIYSGGLTAGRGMAGPSGGQRSLKQYFTGEPVTHLTHEVYGCPLFDESVSVTSCCPNNSFIETKSSK